MVSVLSSKYTSWLNEKSLQPCHTKSMQRPLLAITTTKAFSPDDMGGDSCLAE